VSERVTHKATKLKENPLHKRKIYTVLFKEAMLHFGIFSLWYGTLHTWYERRERGRKTRRERQKYMQE